MIGREHRFTPNDGFIPVFLVVGILSLRCVTLAALVCFTGAVVAGSLGGDISGCLAIAAQATVAIALSLVCHESAHLVAVRARRSRRGIGTVVAGWIQVSIETPVMSLGETRVVALMGPLAGMFMCILLIYLNLNPLLCVSIAAVHLINVCPWMPDGRLLWSSRPSN